jgi:hypothetical protein
MFEHLSLWYCHLISLGKNCNDVGCKAGDSDAKVVMNSTLNVDPVRRSKRLAEKAYFN